MTNKHNRSDKDKKYFIDGSTYNCPFCQRRQIKYKIVDFGEYNSSNTNTVYFYIVRCADCYKISFHLSKYKLAMNYNHSAFTVPLKQVTSEYSKLAEKFKEVEHDLLDDESEAPKELDDVFFYSSPTSFFTIDERIPKSIREPLSEADNCLKSNFLTGASAGLRKAIYKLLKHESIPVKKQKGAFYSHDERVDLLKKKHPKIEGELFNDLKEVHVLTSHELHGNDWEDFNAPTLCFLISVIKDILEEMFVIPDVARERREKISALKDQAKPKKT